MTDGQPGISGEMDEFGQVYAPASAPAHVPTRLPDRITSVRFFSGNVHRMVALALVEGVALVACLWLATVLRFAGDGINVVMGAVEALLWRAPLFVVVVLGAMASMGLYQLRNRARYAAVVARILVAVLMAEAALGLLFYALPSLFIGRGIMGLAGLMAFPALALIRFGFCKIVDQDVFKRRILVWGAGECASKISQRLRRRSDQRGFRVVGYVPLPGDNVNLATETARFISPHQDLLAFALHHRIEHVVVAMDDRRKAFPEQMLREMRLRGIVVSDVVTFLEREADFVSVELAHPSWLIFSDGFQSDIVRLTAKRAFDMAAALAVMVATLPLWLAAALAIWLEDRGPILYRQVRVGENGRPFTILKFRSMSVDAEAGGTAVWAARDDPRVTRVGAFIRKVRIDELPQLLNVLDGTMSFVGPRPERPAFVEKLSDSIPFYRERHFVKPGITGWAQVRYPYGATENDAREKLGYDLYYVKNHSIVFDLMILLLTAEIVLFRVGSR